MLQRKTLGLALSVALLGSAGCLEAEGVGDGAPDNAIDMEINQHVWGIEYLPVEPPGVTEGLLSDPADSGDYQCVTQNFSETRQYDKLVAYSANSESLWPGSIIRGDSVYTGLFTQMVFDRDPLTFSISLENLAGSTVRTMDTPTLSNYRSELNSILDTNVTGATPANLQVEIEEVHSEEQLSLALGASVSWLGSAASISSSFNFRKEQIRSRYLVRYTQAYYTVDADQPAYPSDFFGPGVTPEEVRARLDQDNPPVYVSSITYGRLVVFTFESDYSAEEMNAALDFAYRGGVDVSGNVSVSYKEIISNSKITAFILGGSGGDAARAIDSYESLMDFIRSGGNYSKESPGAPIAYKLAYLADNSPARLSFTTDYESMQCERVSQRVRVTLESIRVDSAGGDWGGDLEIYGNIYVSAGGQTLQLFNRGSGSYAAIREGETWPYSGSISEVILPVAPKSGEEILVGASLKDYDPTSSNDNLGSETQSFLFDTGWRRSHTLYLTGDDARIEVVLRLEPI